MKLCVSVSHDDRKYGVCYTGSDRVEWFKKMDDAVKRRNEINKSKIRAANSTGRELAS